MAKSKSTRKQVSFKSDHSTPESDTSSSTKLSSKSANPSGAGVGNKVNGSTRTSSTSTKSSANAVPQIKNKAILIPFHNVLVLWNMFRQGLTENIEYTLFVGFLTLIPIQLVYNYLIISQLKKKSKDLNVPLLIVSSVIVSMVLSIPLLIVIILFGGPIYGFTIKNILLALHLSQLIFNPLIVLYALDFNQFTKIFEQDHIYRLIFVHPILSASLLTVAGCWLGAIPIPLDWDRPWQQWPITLLVGGYIGGVAGGLLSLVVKPIGA
ncbi:GPI11 [[Candida] subhashii]|uniref:Glycosylphosphatidylinositol anchor biosynthesis protein 11 n=1 Tax=[Candida] subhashii TaxID=561895 RepID=A0A8J5QTM1_9ASCO|nr:GPI11 [[Candida] subhashii]KAG7666053.1 GPI11 [[Candida] subhashii]